jgi:hypothetical protein
MAGPPSMMRYFKARFLVVQVWLAKAQTFQIISKGIHRSEKTTSPQAILEIYLSLARKSN